MAEGRPKQLVANRGFANYANALAAALIASTRSGDQAAATVTASSPPRQSRAYKPSRSHPVPGGGSRELERMLRKIAAGQVKVDE